MKKRTLTYLGMVLLNVLFAAQLFAQTNVNMPFNTGPTTFTIAPPATCFFNFFDDGGPGNNYSNNSGVNSIVTFAPSNAATHRVRATFSELTAENGWDALFIHNGNSVAAPLIAGTAGTVNFGGGGWNSNPGTITSTDATGALTFRFRSDASVPATGWVATVAQVPINACAMTAPANITTGNSPASACSANVTTAAPTFAPAGLQRCFVAAVQGERWRSSRNRCRSSCNGHSP
ncbi:MAG: hypothetical protein IPN76_03410 [Saprospiraceae bacterium]|nr:hypothetical protein [Saprospiraceae bacterium]